MYYEFYGGPQDGAIQKLTSLMRYMVFPAYMLSIPQYIAGHFASLARDKRYGHFYEPVRRWNRYRDGVEVGYEYRGVREL